jgi:tetratricopeptide (TPR) repeat protein
MNLSFSRIGAPLAHLIIIAALGIMAYSNSMDAPFKWDSKSMVVENPIVWDTSQFFSPEKAGQYPQYSAVMRRYVGYLSFALNYRFHGLDVRGYHAVNLLIHILNALLVYLLVRLTLRTPALEGSALRERSGEVALLSGLLFVSHPVQTEAVTYVFQRFASLCAFFSLVSVTSYAGSRLTEKGAVRYLLYALSLVSLLLAMKTKENAFTVPVVIALYEGLFFRGRAWRRALVLVPLLLTMLVVPFSLAGAGEPSGVALVGGEPPPGGYGTVSRGEYLLTQQRVMATYIRLLLLPVNQNIDYDYPVYASLAEPGVLLSLAFILSLLGLSIFLVKRSWAPGPRLMGFGMLWFFVTLSVESSAVPIPMLINEYRLYLPLAGAVVALSAGAALLRGRLGRGAAGRVSAAVFLLVPMVLAMGTLERNRVWESEIGLWEDSVAKSPGKARGHYNLAVVYHKRGKIRKAAGHYKKALNIMPDVPEVHNNLGAAYLSLGIYERSIEHGLEAVRLKPILPGAHNNLGLAYAAKGMGDKAEEHYLEALKLSPDYAEAHNNLGALYGSMGRLEKAIEHLEAALALAPNSPEVNRNLGLAYGKKGLRKKAEGYLQRARELEAKKP